MDFSFLSDLATSSNPISAILGGLTGIVGSIFGKWIDLKKMKADHEHQIALRKLNIVEMTKEHQFRVKEQELITDRTELQGISEGRLEAVKSEGQAIFNQLSIPTEGWVGQLASLLTVILLIPVEAVRKSIRPGITIFFAYHVIQLLEMTKPFFDLSFKDVNGMVAIYALIVNVFLYCFVLTISFWFMGRVRFAEKVFNKFGSISS